MYSEALIIYNHPQMQELLKSIRDCKHISDDTGRQLAHNTTAYHYDIPNRHRMYIQLKNYIE